MRIIFINDIPAPFMVQFAARMNLFNNIDFYLLAFKRELSDRGNHWNDNLGAVEFLRYYKNDVPVIQWIEEIIDEIKPDILFTGINRGEIFELLVRKKAELNFKFGKWNEPYGPLGKAKLFAPFRNYYYKKIWRKTVDFILAIDDRAVSLYRSFVSTPEKIFFFPYYEDTIHAIEPKIAADTVKFLFSGRLLFYHNIKGLARALEILQKKYPGKFELVVSASGPGKKHLDRAESKFPGQKFITYDINFDTWKDRLRPFESSHVLVLPSYQSGWGLVVNEALNLGLPVITTRNVGAARYLVEHMINGIIIKPVAKEIFDSMEYFVLNPNEINRMSANALEVNKRYSLDIGAERLKAIFETILKT
jgi:glycosyltransferase involved in cell wall biosynthesis